MNNEIRIKTFCGICTVYIKGFVGNTQRDLTAISLDSRFIFVTAYKGSREKNMIGIDQFKPILRNISDLTKEIEVNGEKFLPIVEISRIKNNGDWIGIQNGIKPIEENPYYIIQKLIEWHFNVFNLPEGLFIYINTLK